MQAYYDRFKEGKVNTYLLFPGPNESAISKISVPLSQEKGELALLEQFRSEMPPSVYQRFKAEIIYGYAYKKLERNHAKPEDLRWLLVEEILSPQFLALGIDHDQLKYIPAYRRYVEKYLQTLLSQGFWTGDPNWITDLAAFDTAPFHLKGAAKYIFQAHFLGGLTQHYRYYAEYNIRMGQDDILQRIEAFTQKCRDPFLNDQLHELGGFMQGLRIGNRAPDFCLHSLSGNEYCLDFSRGHNVLLLFYRELNQKEITTYNRLQENFPDFHFMYICVDEDEGVWRRKVGEWDLKGIHLHAPGLFVGPSSEYLITGLRKTLLIVDERGRIAENYGLEDSEAQLTAALRRAEIKQQNRAEKRRRYEEDHELDWFSIMVIGLFNLGFMFGLGWLILRWRARRIRKIEARKNEKLELTLRSIRAQMNPHFLFNSLSSIQHLVNSQDNEKANHYLTRFSQLVRKVLQYSEVPLISLQEELDLIRTYAELESLRTPFTLEIDVDPLVDPYTTELPGLLLQPYVENAIRHGLAPLKDRPGRINLTIAKVGYELWITLEDNGIGLEKAKDQKVAVESGGGFGIRLNKERLEALENQWGSSIDVVVEDRKFAFPPAEGTRVEIRLPLEN
ncbi:MAG: histidine kinase [Bacteroidota bacterium]